MTPTPLAVIFELFKNAGAVSIDSRAMPANGLFFAIKGPRFDGNKYARSALANGASAAIVDDPNVAWEDERCYWVPNSEMALQQLAHAYRKTFNIPVVGITGSNGKTTTKELVAAVLSRKFRVHVTAGNLNNHLGVPLTLLAMPKETDIAIIEMGANHQGEIAHLSAIAEPDHGLITNIGKAHLEGFGGIEGVKKGKSELYRHLESVKGTAFVNIGEKFLMDLVQGVPHILTYYAAQNEPKEADFSCQIHQVSPFIRLSFRDSGTEYHCETQLFGIYNVQNIITALALGQYFQVKGEAICEALSDYQPGNNRSQKLVRGETTFLLDAYNANPTSMENALRYFGELQTPEKKMAILGDMLELGDDTHPEHERMVEFAISMNLDQLVLVGKHFELPAKSRGLLHFTDMETLKAWFDRGKWANYRILIKASRGLALERLIAEDAKENV